MTVLVDSSILVAAADRRDTHHDRAADVLRRAAEDRPFVTDHVVLETWLVLRRRRGWSAAMRLWDSLDDSPVRLEPVAGIDLERARTIAAAWEDQGFDLVDCTSFAVMERLGCARAATFDRDFAVYRYGPERRKAFEILP